MLNAHIASSPAAADAGVCVPSQSAWHERLFSIILPVILCACIALGLYMKTIAPRAHALCTAVRQIHATFAFVQPEPARRIVPVAPIRRAKIPPVDLTARPAQEQAPDHTPEPQAPARAAVRPVYGLRKVYAHGIGSGGSLADAVIGKLGNTLNTPVDTLVATESDIKGKVVSTATVTIAPRFKKRVTPDYSQEMLDNRIEGVVKVKVLVDIDGRVKKAMALNDLGYASARQALAATLDMEFEPAVRDNEPVAVWIIIPIRFVMLG